MLAGELEIVEGLVEVRGRTRAARVEVADGRAGVRLTYLADMYVDGKGTTKGPGARGPPV